MTFAEQVTALTLADMRATATRIAADIVETPLLALDPSDSASVRIKPECLQPLGSFKIRCATNAIMSADPALLARGAATASAGNFAQGLALAARRRGLPLTVHVPESAPANKVDAIEALGATVVRHTFARWWEIMSTRETGQDDGLFIHPVCEPSVVLGNATIGLEIARQWPDVEAIVVPVGGGGLAIGIALACRALNIRARIVGCEVATFAPLTAALRAGAPVTIDRSASFVDGIGSLRVLDQMWPLLRTMVDEVIAVPVERCADAVRTLAKRSHMIAEGAGACALAAAQSPGLAGSRVVAVVSGGNIGHDVLADLLHPVAPS